MSPHAAAADQPVHDVQIVAEPIRLRAGDDTRHGRRIRATGDPIERCRARVLDSHPEHRRADPGRRTHHGGVRRSVARPIRHCVLGILWRRARPDESLPGERGLAAFAFARRFRSSRNSVPAWGAFGLVSTTELSRSRSAQVDTSFNSTSPIRSRPPWARSLAADPQAQAGSSASTSHEVLLMPRRTSVLVMIVLSPQPQATPNSSPSTAQASADNCKSWHRAVYAATRTFITRSRSGEAQFNLSGIGGNAISAAVSNAY